LKRRVLVAASTLLAVATILGALWLWAYYPATVYRTFERGDRAYRVDVMRYPTRFPSFSFAGQAGDAPGYVRLCDSRGHVLEEVRVDMVSLVDQVEWEAGRVRVGLVATWYLPAP
jgi:hypothetical protein